MGVVCAVPQAYFTLHVFYHRVDGGSLWDEEALFAISQYENRLHYI